MVDGAALLVPRAQLRRSPSRLDGVSAVQEKQLRVYGVELIQRACVLLRVRQIVSVSAATVFQRFYFRRSLADVDVRLAVSASVLLACKLEEQHRRLRDVVTVLHRLQQRRLEGNPYLASPTPPLDAAGWQWMKEETVRIEQVMLRDLGFAVMLVLEHPHKFVFQFVKSIIRSPAAATAEVAQKAWNYLNDSMRTTLCCRYRPHEIATASIYLAARATGVRLPSDPPWWEVFDTELEDVQKIARTIVKLYDGPPARYVRVVRPVEPQQSPVLQQSPIAPFTPWPETPCRSPSGERDGTPPEWGSVDLGRIGEMIKEQDQAATGSAPRCRSRSPKRKVITISVQQPGRPVAKA